MEYAINGGITMKKSFFVCILLIACLISRPLFCASGDPVLNGSTPTLVGTNISGTASGLTAGNVTTNANLTGDVTSVGNATTIKEAPTIKSPTLNPGTEIVSNGSDWTGGPPPTGWTEFDCTASAVGGGQSGNALQLTRTGAAIQYVQSFVTTVTGHVYLLSIYVKSGTSGDEAFKIYTQGGDFNFGAPQISGTSSGSWVQYATTFIANGDTLLVVMKNSATVGTMLFDSLSLTELPLTVNGDIYLTRNIRIVIPTFSNNAAAIAGGLVAGQLYRVNPATDPEPIYIVH